MLTFAIGLLISLFLYWRLRPLLPEGKFFSLAMAAALLGVLSLIILRRVLRDYLGDFADEVEAAGALCFGFTLLTAASAAFTLLAQGVLKFAGQQNIAARRRLWAALCLLLALGACAWSFIEARNPSLQTVIVRSPYYHGPPLKILQIADLHLGGLGGEQAMRRALEFYHQSQPDLLVNTGDFIDGRQQALPLFWSEAWHAIKPPLGKFAVLGNHEFGQARQNLAFIRQCGFTVLRNFGLTLNENIYIAGVDDSRFNNPIAESSLWSGAQPDVFRLLLKHRPDVEASHARTFDLQLSGHTHGGQFYPGYWFTKIRHPMNQGLYELAYGSYLYVDKGLGTWGPPMRFLTAPQATLIILSGI